MHNDVDLSLSTQISKTVSTGFFYLRQIRSIRRCLPIDAAKSLVNALVISRLDYCNGLYVNIQQGQIVRLQSVLNDAARLIFGVSRFSHVSPLHHDRIHWLRCRERIQFKMWLMVYKALNGMAPSYFSDLCITEDINERRRTLRSALTSTMTLIQPRCTPSTKFGDRAFAVAAPAAWNNLQNSIRTAVNMDLFKRQLKTHLFQISFSLLQAALRCNIHDSLFMALYKLFKSSSSSSAPIMVCTGHLHRSRSAPVEVSTGQGLHRSRSALVTACTGQGLHRSRSAPVKVCTGQDLHWSRSALVKACTGQGLHRSRSAPVKVCTGQGLHQSRSAPVQVCTGYGLHQSRSAMVTVCTSQDLHWSKSAPVKVCTVKVCTGQCLHRSRSALVKVCTGQGLH